MLFSSISDAANRKSEALKPRSMYRPLFPRFLPSMHQTETNFKTRSLSFACISSKIIANGQHLCIPSLVLFFQVLQMYLPFCGISISNAKLFSESRKEYERSRVRIYNFSSRERLSFREVPSIHHVIFTYKDRRKVEFNAAAFHLRVCWGASGIIRWLINKEKREELVVLS